MSNPRSNDECPDCGAQRCPVCGGCLTADCVGNDICIGYGHDPDEADDQPDMIGTLCATPEIAGAVTMLQRWTGTEDREDQTMGKKLPLHDVLAHDVLPATHGVDPVPTDGLAQTPVVYGNIVTREDDTTLTLTPMPPTPPPTVAPPRTGPTPSSLQSATKRWWGYAIAGLQPQGFQSTTPRLVCVMRGKDPCYLIAEGRTTRTKHGITKDWFQVTAEEAFTTPEVACLHYDGLATLPDDAWNPIIAAGDTFVSYGDPSPFGRVVQALLWYAYQGAGGVGDAIAETTWGHHQYAQITIPTTKVATATYAPSTLTRLLLGCVNCGIRLDITSTGRDSLLLIFTPEDQPGLREVLDAHADVDGDPERDILCEHPVFGEVRVMERAGDDFVIELLSGDKGGIVVTVPADTLTPLYEIMDDDEDEDNS